jgi:hypothetical protein
MLVACRLAGLSALETYYAGGRARAQCGPTGRAALTYCGAGRAKGASVCGPHPKAGLSVIGGSCDVPPFTPAHRDFATGWAIVRSARDHDRLATGSRALF